MTALFCSAVLGYMAGVRQSTPAASLPSKSYVLNVGPVHVILSVGAMGILVIFLLVILLGAAILFAAIASHRRRQAEKANCVLRDEIRERKRAEEEVNQLNSDLENRVVERTEQLDASNKDLEAFSYSVAHDLRAPLRHINGFSKLLQDHLGTTLDATALRHLSSLRDSAKTMGQLIDDLLKMGRIGRQELACRPTDLNSLVESARLDLEAECKGRQIDWRVGELPSLECDPGLMKLVLTNLLSNAVKYTQRHEKAIIEVGQVILDGATAIFVRDDGAGFDQRYSHKLFGVFQRLHATEEFEGTGIGLATVQRIIRKHGGRIWAEAEVDKGATFFFTLGASSRRSANAAKSVAAGKL
jgi:light-regulated signal transduction histidine kinase (bacteriophytochrome)